MKVPHMRVVIAFCIAAISFAVGFARTHIGDHVRRNAVALRKLSDDPRPSRFRTYLSGLFLGEHGIVDGAPSGHSLWHLARPVIITSRQLVRVLTRPVIGAIFVFAKRHTIGGIFFSGRPTQIARAVVHSIAVTMGTMRLTFGTRPVERGADNEMGRVFERPPINTESLDRVASTDKWPKDRSALAANTSLGRNEVSGRKGYGGPFFGAKFSVSHGAGSLRGGQGRALCNQRFRPVLLSTNPAIYQRIAA